MSNIHNRINDILDRFATELESVVEERAREMLARTIPTLTESKPKVNPQPDLPAVSKRDKIISFLSGVKSASAKEIGDAIGSTPGAARHMVNRLVFSGAVEKEGSSYKIASQADEMFTERLLRMVNDRKSITLDVAVSETKHSRPSTRAVMNALFRKGLITKTVADGVITYHAKEEPKETREDDIRRAIINHLGDGGKTAADLVFDLRQEPNKIRTALNELVDQKILVKDLSDEEEIVFTLA